MEPDAFGVLLVKDFERVAIEDVDPSACKRESKMRVARSRTGCNQLNRRTSSPSHSRHVDCAFQVLEFFLLHTAADDFPEDFHSHNASSLNCLVNCCRFASEHLLGRIVRFLKCPRKWG